MWGISSLYPFGFPFYVPRETTVRTLSKVLATSPSVLDYDVVQDRYPLLMKHFCIIVASLRTLPKMILNLILFFLCVFCQLLGDPLWQMPGIILHGGLLMGTSFSSAVVCVWRSVVNDLTSMPWSIMLFSDRWQPSFSIAFEDEASETWTSEKSTIFPEFLSIYE